MLPAVARHAEEGTREIEHAGRTDEGLRVQRNADAGGDQEEEDEGNQRRRSQVVGDPRQGTARGERGHPGRGLAVPGVGQRRGKEKKNGGKRTKRKPKSRENRRRDNGRWRRRSQDGRVESAEGTNERRWTEVEAKSQWLPSLLDAGCWMSLPLPLRRPVTVITACRRQNGVAPSTGGAAARWIGARQVLYLQRPVRAASGLPYSTRCTVVCAGGPLSP